MAINKKIRISNCYTVKNVYMLKATLLAVNESLGWLPVPAKLSLHDNFGKK